MQEERNTKGELKQLLASTVQSERAAEKKLADVSAEVETVSSRLAKAEAVLQVSFVPRPSAPELPVLFMIRSSPNTWKSYDQAEQHCICSLTSLLASALLARVTCHVRNASKEKLPHLKMMVSECRLSALRMTSWQQLSRA